MAATHLIAEMHPWRTISEDVLKPLGMSVNGLAKELRIPTTRLNDIVRGRRGITAETALRLARYRGTSAQFWLNLQSSYELRVAEHQKGPAIRKQVNPRSCPPILFITGALMCWNRGFRTSGRHAFPPKQNALASGVRGWIRSWEGRGLALRRNQRDVHFIDGNDQLGVDG